MLAEPISTITAEHYIWGNHCDGWHLVRTHELSIIEEHMPPSTAETRHHHLHARQFFYVLQGHLTMKLEDRTLILQAGDGIEIAPGQSHQAINHSEGHVRFLVTSQPSTQGDRINE